MDLLAYYLVCCSATCVWDQSSWHWWAATASTACVVQLGAVADRLCSWPMAKTFACLCSCQRRIFWTHFWLINLFSLYLFSLYLMNFMFHTMLDAAGDVLRVHYKSTKCDVSFSQGSESMIFRWDRHFYTCVKDFSCLQQCNNYKNQSRFFKVMIAHVLPHFYGWQCMWWIVSHDNKTTIH